MYTHESAVFLCPWYIFYVLCPKLALIGKKIGTNMFENWHQYIYNLRQYIQKLAPIYLQFTHFFHLCHTNLQVMTPGVEDRVQTLSLGLEAPPFEGVLQLSSLTISYQPINNNYLILFNGTK